MLSRHVWRLELLIFYQVAVKPEAPVGRAQRDLRYTRDIRWTEKA
jgi:hypothetical protein